MICKKCNAEISDSASFCTVCGTPVEKAQPVYQAPMNQQTEVPAYQQPEQPVYQQPEQPVYQQPVYQQAAYQQPQVILQNQNTVSANQGEVAPVTKISSYIGWWLIPYIPFVGFILMIVFAVDGKNKNRANYFRAMFLVALIAIFISVIPLILMLIISPSIIDDISREISYMI